MWILGLEAGAALFLLVFIVWWTMYAGRKPEQAAPPRAERAPAPPSVPAASGANETPDA